MFIGLLISHVHRLPSMSVFPLLCLLLSLLIMYALGVKAIYLGFITIIVGMMIYYFEKETKERKNGHAGQSVNMGNQESNEHKLQN